MKAKKWYWKIDQWFEDKVWTKVPPEEHSPHFFFVCGVWAGGGFTLLLYAILKMILT